MESTTPSTEIESKLTVISKILTSIKEIVLLGFKDKFFRLIVIVIVAIIFISVSMKEDIYKIYLCILAGIFILILIAMRDKERNKVRRKTSKKKKSK